MLQGGVVSMHYAVMGREMLTSLCDDEYVSRIEGLQEGIREGCSGCFELQCLLQALLIDVPKPEKIAITEWLAPSPRRYQDPSDDKGGALDG